MSKIIYAFTYPEYKGLLKVGETVRSVEERLRQNIIMPSKCEIVLEVEVSHTTSDKDIHKELKKMGVKHVNGEWFECTKEDVICAILRVHGINAVKRGFLYGDFENLFKEGIEFRKKFGNIDDFDVVAKAIDLYKNLGAPELEQFCKFVNICNSFINTQKEGIIRSIASYGLGNVIEKFDSICEKVELISQLGIKKVMEKKSALDSMISLHDKYGNQIFTALEKAEELKELLTIPGLSAATVRRVLERLEKASNSAKDLGMSEKEYLKELEDCLKEAEEKMTLLRCNDLGDLYVRLQECSMYLDSKEDIEKTEQLWKELGIRNMTDFLKLRKELHKEREEQKKSFAINLTKDADEEFVNSCNDAVFTFGKHKGELIKDVIYQNKNYINWYTNESIETLQRIYILSEQVKNEKKDKKKREKSVEDLGEIFQECLFY